MSLGIGLRAFALCLALVANASSGDEVPQSWQAYDAHLETGANHLRNGEPMAALQELVAADKMDLFEVPNYQALAGIAEAKCRLGAPEAGLTDLAAFLCAVEVDAGKLPCYLNEDDPAGPLQGNPGLNELCRERMCGEIYLPYYESTDPAKAERLEALRVRAGKVREICNATTTGRIHEGAVQDGAVQDGQPRVPRSIPLLPGLAARRCCAHSACGPSRPWSSQAVSRPRIVQCPLCMVSAPRWARGRPHRAEGRSGG